MAEYDEVEGTEDEQANLKRTLKTFAVPILITLYYLWRFYQEPSYVCTSMAGELGTCWEQWKVMLVSFPLWFSLLAIEKDLKLGTQKAIATDLHTTTTGRRWGAGDFWIIRAGGLRWRGFEVEGRQGLWIFHKTALTLLGREMVINADLRPTPLKSLPKPVKDKIRDLGWEDMKPFKFGLIDSQRYVRKINMGQSLEGILPGKLNELEPDEFNTLFAEANRISNTYEKLNDAALNKLEKLDGQIARINSQRGLWESIRGFVSKKPKEEE